MRTSLRILCLVASLAWTLTLLMLQAIVAVPLLALYSLRMMRGFYGMCRRSGCREAWRRLRVGWRIGRRLGQRETPKLFHTLLGIALEHNLSECVLVALIDGADSLAAAGLDRREIERWAYGFVVDCVRTREEAAAHG